MNVNTLLVRRVIFRTRNWKLFIEKWWLLTLGHCMLAIETICVNIVTIQRRLLAYWDWVAEPNVIRQKIWFLGLVVLKEDEEVICNPSKTIQMGKEEEEEDMLKCIYICCLALLVSVIVKVLFFLKNMCQRKGWWIIVPKEPKKKRHIKETPPLSGGRQPPRRQSGGPENLGAAMAVSKPRLAG